VSEIVVLITASGEDEAVKIARSLVEARLAGCVNIIKNIRSVYRWEETVEDEPEILMVAKTRKTLFHELIKKVQALHSYTVPEIIALPIIDGSEDYLKWLRDVTG